MAAVLVKQAGTYVGILGLAVQHQLGELRVAGLPALHVRRDVACVDLDRQAIDGPASGLTDQLVPSWETDKVQGRTRPGVQLSSAAPIVVDSVRSATR